MLEQVGHTLLQCLQVLVAQVSLGHAAIVLQGADGGNDDNRAGLQASHAALDVQELLSAQVSAEAGLGDGVVRKAHGDLGGGDGVAPVGDVGEGPAVDKRGGVLQGLDQVGLEGVLEQGGHSALGVQVAGGDGLLIIGVAHHQTGQTLLQVGDVAGQAQYGHDLGGHGDVVAVLTGHAVDAAAQAVGDETQLAVIHVHAAAPGDPAGVDAQLVALIDMVIQHGGQQVVGSADGVEVAGKVEVDVLHRNDLSIAAAGCAALDAEHRAQGGLAQSDQNIFAQLLHAVGQADSGGRLALTGRGGVDGGNQDQLALPLLGLVEDVVVNLGLVVAVLL